MSTRTALALSNLNANGVLNIPAGSAIDQANGMTISLTTTSIPASPSTECLMLFVATTNGTDKTVTIKAGVGGGATPGPAFRSGLGDLVVTATAASGGGVVGPLEPARFAQSDGSINIDFQSGITGTITAFMMPIRW